MERGKIMSKTTELKEALSELNKNLVGLQGVFNNYRGLTARLSRTLYDSLGILVEKSPSLIFVKGENA